MRVKIIVNGWYDFEPFSFETQEQYNDFIKNVVQTIMIVKNVTGSYPCVNDEIGGIGVGLQIYDRSFFINKGFLEIKFLIGQKRK